MTDRPTESLDWATSGTNILAPSSGKRAQGWLPGEAPPAQNFNWWKNLAGRWVDYIVERLDDITIPDVSDVVRLTVVNSGVINASGDIGSGATLHGSQVTSTHDVHANGDVTAGSDVEASRDLIAHRNVVATGSISGTGVDAGTGSVSGASVSAGSGLVHGGAGSFSGDVVISGGTGVFKYQALRPTETELNLALGVPLSAAPITYSGDGRWSASTGAASSFLQVPIQLPPGAVLYGVDVFHKQEGHAAALAVVVKSSNWTSVDPAGASSIPLAGEAWGGGAITDDADWRRDKIESALGAGLAIDADTTYDLRWSPGDDGATLARVRLRWGNPGP